MTAIELHRLNDPGFVAMTCDGKSRHARPDQGVIKTAATTDAAGQRKSATLVPGLLISLALHGVVFATVTTISPRNTPPQTPAALVETPIVATIIPAPITPPLPQAMRPTSPAKSPPLSRMPPRPAVIANNKIVSPNASATPAPLPVMNTANANLETTRPAVIGAADSEAATGPTLVAARADAAYLNNPKPTYPSLSRRMREEGKVLLQVVVTTEGIVENARISQGSGFTRLDAAALDVVRQWRFVPAHRGSENVRSSVIVPLTFRLED